jgi:hypothetical protein
VDYCWQLSVLARERIYGTLGRPLFFAQLGALEDAMAQVWVGKWKYIGGMSLPSGCSAGSIIQRDNIKAKSRFEAKIFMQCNVWARLFRGEPTAEDLAVIKISNMEQRTLPPRRKTNKIKQ